MSRILLLVCIFALLMAALGATFGMALAENGSFQPGDPLYAYQRMAEEQRLKLFSNDTDRVLYRLDLGLRRANDVIILVGTDREEMAMSELNEQIDQLVLALRSTPASDIPLLQEKLVELVIQVDAIQAILEQSNSLLAALLEKVAIFRTLVTAEQLANARTAAQLKQFAHQQPANSGQDSSGSATSLQMVDPRAVSFPPGSAGAEHDFFPLTGQHAALDCETCHEGGRYAGTPKTCEACHNADKPANHFTGLCVSCHTTNAWKPARFNHQAAGATNCTSCHTRDKPANHFTGQCSLCHNTNAWKPARFNHQAVRTTDCTSCHIKDKPRNHFSGQCSLCHNTNAWKPATFNHQNAGTDCQSCHANDRPRNHPTGQCSNCHTTNAWRPANFSHQNATDCQSCHASDRPNSHPAGQCSNCHTTNAWKPANFSHQNATDCQSCHAGDRPGNHYSGQCSSCHSTNAWRPANFSHQNVGNDCQSCHNRPSGHWQGQCSQCHATDGWGNIRTGWHSFPMRHGDANGNCSRCHSGTNTSVNCYTCHDRQRMENHHAEKNIFDIAGRCLQCHPGGKED